MVHERGPFKAILNGICYLMVILVLKATQFFYCNLHPNFRTVWDVQPVVRHDPKLF